MAFTMWLHKIINLKPRQRGFHLIDDEIIYQLPEIKSIHTGLLHLFIQHTSASLTINENADNTVRQDFEAFFNRFIPENSTYFKHDYEGSDDMPAHLKASILGHSVCIPIHQAKLQLGTWQGIYLGEHRNHGGMRKLVATLQGE
jgi:secondary thiamine-phosphate synthase enzyme